MDLKRLIERALTPLYTKKPEPEGPRYADMYARAIAAAMDFSILYLLFNAPFRWLTGALYRHVNLEVLGQAQQQTSTLRMWDLLWQSQLPQWWAVNAAIQVAVMGVVIVGSQMLWGTTPGKWLMGVRIVRYPSLERPARWRFLLRFLAYIPAAGCLMIGIFWVSFNRERRGWHDYIAGTAVLNERPGKWYWNKAKQLYAKARGRSLPVEEPVGEPAAKERE